MRAPPVHPPCTPLVPFWALTGVKIVLHQRTVAQGLSAEFEYFWQDEGGGGRQKISLVTPFVDLPWQVPKYGRLCGAVQNAERLLVGVFSALGSTAGFAGPDRGLAQCASLVRSAFGLQPSLILYAGVSGVGAAKSGARPEIKPFLLFGGVSVVREAVGFESATLIVGEAAGVLA